METIQEAIARQTAERAARGLDANGGIVDARLYDTYLTKQGK